MRRYIFIVLLFTIEACHKDNAIPINLRDYIQQNSDLQLSHSLIACAAGGEKGFMEDSAYPLSEFFYPIKNSYEFRYFETTGEITNILDYTQFREKQLVDVPVFNGYLRRFKNNAIQDNWGIVTYKTGNTLHVCRAIHNKLHSVPTQFAPELVTISTNGINPGFTWVDGTAQNTVIYFEVVSDTLGNLISGTYTYDKNFTFYDTSNVVLNIHDIQPPPILQHNVKYVFTLMGVSYDNWVNLIAQKAFVTQ